MRYPEEWRARAWLWEAAALAEWDLMRPSFRRLTEAEAVLARVPRLSRECSDLGHWFREWRRGGLAMGSLPPGGGPLAHQLQQACTCLSQCGETLVALQAGGWPAQDELAVADRREALREIDAELAEATAWPPLILAELQGELALEGDSVAAADSLLHSAARGPLPAPMARAEEIVMLALADRLVAAGAPATDPAWEVVERHGNRLTGEMGGRLSLVRKPDPDPRVAMLDETLRLGQPPQLVSPGLVVRKGTGLRVVQAARLKVARPCPEAVILFRRLATRFSDGDRSGLKVVFGDVAEDIAPYRDLTSWWNSFREVGAGHDTGRLERLGRFWQAVQRAASLASLSDPVAPLARDLLASLGETFTFVPPRGGAPCGTFWLLAPWQRGGEVIELTGTPTPALRGPGPDFLVLEPAGWIRVPVERQDESPLLPQVVRAQALITGLREFDRDWKGWEEYGKILFDLAFRSSAMTAEPVEPTSMIAAFEATRLRARESGHGLSAAYGELARRLLAALTEAGLQFTPRLDPITLEPQPLETPLSDGTRIRWVADPHKPGTVLDVVKLGLGKQPAELKVSVGPSLPPELGVWLDWVQEEHPPDPSELDVPPAVLAWRNDLQTLLPNVQQLRAQWKQRKDEFLAWCRGDESGMRFDRLVRHNDKHTQALLDAILGGGWCPRFWPDVNRDRTYGVWPRDHRTAAAPHVVWDPIADIPFGYSRWDNFTFAPELRLIRGTFSLGSPPPDSVLHAAVEITYAVKAPEWVSKVMAKPVRDLVWGQIDAELGVDAPAASDLLGPVLDALMIAARSKPGQLEPLEVVLRAVQAWADARGLTVLPASWSFVHPATAERLLAEGLDVPVAEFVDGGVAGGLQLRELGWSRADGGPGRPPRLTQDAGPPPAYYKDLRRALGEATSWPPASDLLAELEGWPQRRLDGLDVLRSAAEHSFGSFWEAAGPQPHEPAVSRAADLLSRLLQEEFGLETFYPRSTRDFSREAIKVASRGNQNTGNVKRVVRPGLRNQNEAISFSAVVDLE
jgi:hypothetical protein